MSYCLPFHTVHGVLKARILKWFAIPFSSGCQTSPPWPTRLGWPHVAWLSFTVSFTVRQLDKLDKAVVHVIRLAGFLWLWFQSVCPLFLYSVYCLTCFLLPWTWGISSRLLQQSVAAAPDLGHGVSHLSHCSWPWMWGISPGLVLRCLLWVFQNLHFVLCLPCLQTGLNLLLSVCLHHRFYFVDLSSLINFSHHNANVLSYMNCSHKT